MGWRVKEASLKPKKKKRIRRRFRQFPDENRFHFCDLEEPKVLALPNASQGKIFRARTDGRREQEQLLTLYRKGGHRDKLLAARMLWQKFKLKIYPVAS